MAGRIRRVARRLRPRISLSRGRFGEAGACLDRRCEQQLEQLRQVKRDLEEAINAQKRLHLQALSQQIHDLEGALEQLTESEERLHAWSIRFAADASSADSRRPAGEAEAYLSAALTNAGQALARVASAMARAVEGVEQIKADTRTPSQSNAQPPS